MYRPVLKNRTSTLFFNDLLKYIISEACCVSIKQNNEINSIDLCKLLILRTWFTSAFAIVSKISKQKSVQSRPGVTGQIIPPAQFIPGVYSTDNLLNCGLYTENKCCVFVSGMQEICSSIMLN